jgi:hypothetical protein
VSQLNVKLQSLSETQEYLIIVQDYIERIASPLIALSYIGLVEGYLDRQRQENIELLAITTEVLNFIRDLKSSRN